MNYAENNPAVSPVFNTDCVAGCTVLTCSCTAIVDYWSSSSIPVNAAFAWYIDFQHGIVAVNLKSDGGIVRAVRGGL